MKRKQKILLKYCVLSTPQRGESSVKQTFNKTILNRRAEKTALQQREAKENVLIPSNSDLCLALKVLSSRLLRFLKRNQMDQSGQKMKKAAPIPLMTYIHLSSLVLKPIRKRATNQLNILRQPTIMQRINPSQKSQYLIFQCSLAQQINFLNKNLMKKYSTTRGIMKTKKITKIPRFLAISLSSSPC